MSPSKPKPADIAAEAKRVWMPYIWKNIIADPKTSYLFPDAELLPRTIFHKRFSQRTRVAVMQGDPVTYALGWCQSLESAGSHSKKIAVVNGANEERAGGDWESGIMAQEECFARRSNLVHALTMPWGREVREAKDFYPIPPKGGIFSPQVCGPEQDYALFNEISPIPVISVTPVRRPKLDESGTKYVFAQEKELMLGKMRAVLRIALHCAHSNLVVGAFGLGHPFRNPATEVARMWKKLIFEEEEFQGVFQDIVFAIDSSMVSDPPLGCASDLQVFQREFDPQALFPANFDEL
ncbi:hypothetical protein ACEQ8H_000889 [Pleosporales sp. CAS-2024a]